MKVKFMVAAVAACASWSALAGGIAAGITTVTPDTAYQVCDGNGTTGKTNVYGGPGTVLDSTVTPVFTRTGFAIQCSSNVLMSVNEVSNTLAVVSSASKKGNQFFGGHTNGGSITPLGKCTGTNDACQDADITSGITKAKEAASSS
jgi:hypothetical protein